MCEEFIEWNKNSIYSHEKVAPINFNDAKDDVEYEEEQPRQQYIARPKQVSHTEMMMELIHLRIETPLIPVNSSSSLPPKKGPQTRQVTGH